MAHKAPVAIIGGGLMGAGIAQCFAIAGYAVRVHEPFEAVRNTVLARIREGLAQVGDDPAAVNLVEVTDQLDQAVAGVQYVTEAAPEKLEVKHAIFAQLIDRAPRDAILASNSSVMPIGSIAGDLPTAERIVGTHWWNPAVLIPLVEVVQGAKTSQATIDKTMALLEDIGKKPAHVKKDVAGFVANRLQHALWREAIAMVADGICDAKTVDDCVKNSFGMRLPVLGPLENADMVGLDLTLDIHRTIIPELDRSAGPNSYLKAKVELGALGFKTGQGFQNWSPEAQQALRSKLVAHLVQQRQQGGE